MQQRIQFSATINGQKTGPHELPKDLMMIEFLQEYAGLNGTRLAPRWWSWPYPRAPAR